MIPARIGVPEPESVAVDLDDQVLDLVLPELADPLEPDVKVEVVRFARSGNPVQLEPRDRERLRRPAGIDADEARVAHQVRALVVAAAASKPLPARRARRERGVKQHAAGRTRMVRCPGSRRRPRALAVPVPRTHLRLVGRVRDKARDLCRCPRHVLRTVGPGTAGPLAVANVVAADRGAARVVRRVPSHREALRARATHRQRRGREGLLIRSIRVVDGDRDGRGVGAVVRRDGHGEGAPFVVVVPADLGLDLPRRGVDVEPRPVPAAKAVGEGVAAVGVRCRDGVADVPGACFGGRGEVFFDAPRRTLPLGEDRKCVEDRAAVDFHQHGGFARHPADAIRVVLVPSGVEAPAGGSGGGGIGVRHANRVHSRAAGAVKHHEVPRVLVEYGVRRRGELPDAVSDCGVGERRHAAVLRATTWFPEQVRVARSSD